MGYSYMFKMFFGKKQLLRLFLVLGFSVGVLSAQNQGNLVQVNNCPNLDLSMGNFTNWVGRTGSCCPINLPTVGIVNGRHTIMSPGNDPIVPALPLVPPGYTRSARLGNSGTGAQGEGLRYTYNVASISALFEYVFAVVLEDPGHSASQQPRFELQVLNQNNQPIPCTFYQVTAAGNIPGFQTSGGVRWRNWTKVGVDLTGYIGQNVTIEARTGDCSLSGHYGYGYLVGSCSPLVISVAYCIGDSVATLIAPNGFSNYQWRIQGNPTIISTQQSHIINNPANGIVYECVVTSVMGCSATLSAVVNPVIPFPGFTYTTGCGNTVNFTDTTFVQNGIAATWVWDFGDGNTSTQQNPTHVYAAPGTYNVKLKAGTTVGCPDSVVIPVTVDADPVAQFAPPTQCGLTGTYTDQSFVPNGQGNITGWLWNFGDGNTSTQQSPTHTYAQSGQYNVSLTVTSSNGCNNTFTVPLATNAYPNANFTGSTECHLDSTAFTDQSVVQLTNITNWLWFFGDGTTSTQQHPNHVYQAPGTYNVTLIAGTAANCTDTITQQITVKPNPQPAFNSTQVCIGLPTTFTNLSNISSGIINGYNWDFGHPAVPASIQDNPTVQYPTFGTFNVTLTATSDLNCVGSVTQPVNIWPRPDVSFNAGPLAGCAPVSPQFNNTTTIAAGQVVTWLWNFGDGAFSTVMNPNHLYPNAAGTYSVTLLAVSDRGCDSTIVIPNYITVYPQPDAEFAYTPPFPTVLKTRIQFVNQSIQGESYAWEFGEGSTSTIANPVFTYPMDTGTYYVTLVAYNSFGCADTVQHALRIGPDYTLFIPNTFTPNADGFNDHFKVHGMGIVEVTMDIFDRWGDKVASLQNLEPMQKGWDGTKDREPVKQDVYVYKIMARDIFGEWHEYHGNINLVR